MVSIVSDRFELWLAAQEIVDFLPAIVIRVNHSSHLFL
jgi:hypothetical protein